MLGGENRMNRQLRHNFLVTIILGSSVLLIVLVLVLASTANNSEDTARDEAPSEPEVKVSNGRPWFTGTENIQSCTVTDSRCIDVRALSNGDEIITVYYNGVNSFDQSRCTNDDVGPYCLGTLQDGTLVKLRNYP